VTAQHEDLARLQAVRRRLEEHAAAGPPPGLTDPDPGGTEQWEAGQVWAHLAEFPPYWLAQVSHILERRGAGDPEPIPFGRTKTDPDRIAAIERDRHDDPQALLRRVTDGIAATVQQLEGLPAEAWAAQGSHPTRGVMTPRQIVETFIVDHLEEHVEQLDRLAEARDG
jgi:DinB superfamily